MSEAKKIRLFKPSIGKEELKNINQIFKTSWLGYGNKVNEFENKFSKFIGKICCRSKFWNCSFTFSSSFTKF